MNFEHFNNKISKLLYKSLRLKIAQSRWIEYNRIHNLLLQKLKLGNVAFDLKEIFYGELKIYEFLEMRFSRQDNTIENSLKIETRLEKLKWKLKWNYFTIVLFIIFFSLLIYFIYIYLSIWWENNIAKTFEYTIRYNTLTKQTFDILFQNISSFEKFSYPTNIFLIDILIKFCDYYRIFK